jgi:hypothetical protein
LFYCLIFLCPFFSFLEKGGDPNKTVTAKMVAHQYDDKGRSTRASGSEDPQSTDNTPQPLPKKTRYSLRSVPKSKEIPQAHSGASCFARQISEPSTCKEIPQAHSGASGYARQISGPSTSKEIPRAHAEASGFARQISEHEDDDVMGNDVDQMDVDRIDEIDEDRPPNFVHPYAKYTVNHIFSKPSIDFYKDPLIEDLIMENLVTSVEVMQS